MGGEENLVTCVVEGIRKSNLKLKMTPLAFSEASASAGLVHLFFADLEATLVEMPVLHYRPIRLSDKL